MLPMVSSELGKDFIRNNTSFAAFLVTSVAVVGLLQGRIGLLRHCISFKGSMGWLRQSCFYRVCE